MGYKKKPSDEKQLSLEDIREPGDERCILKVRSGRKNAALRDSPFASDAIPTGGFGGKLSEKSFVNTGWVAPKLRTGR